ncbi:MAG: ferric reductase-like transmembrane domain-containing protein [Candidatus Polarisedimenticolaceae bacterium]|nr:ferric reductase-like transmembrane domain-containing protein [Candidatus Polarisedimenticolaceae bacterium]
MTPFFSALCWLSVYLVLVLAPLFVLLTGSVPAGSGFWWDFSMALGFTGMAMMGVQFFLTARFRHVSAPFGIDIIYYFHRYLALMAFGLIFLHFLIIRIDNVEALGVINPLQASWYMTAGRASLMLFALLIITSLWRKPLRIHYDEWRMLHIGLAVAAFLLALGHIEGVGYYIDAPAKRWLWSGYTLFWVLLIVYVRLIKPWQMHHRPYRVTEVRQERSNSWTLALEPDGHEGMRFKPGQFAWLTLRESPWHVKEHPFSFSSSAARQDRLEFTIKELGDFTRTIKETQIGEIAYLDGPYGAFSVDRYRGAPGFVFIAGGVGAAPIVSILSTLADRHEHRPLWFIYSNNCWEDVIFREALETLKERLDLRLIHVLAEPPTGWKGETGFITQALLRKALPSDMKKYEYFLCGPKPMSDAVQQELHTLQVPLGKVHFELFDMV